MNGNREQSNNFLLDGLDNNQVPITWWVISRTDAIQEFNMITNNAPADFGNFQGGIISATIKSGTNELHGTVYEFLRNDALNANTWENNWQGSPKGKVRWNQFGASAGGPIIKNKLFIFGDYAGRRNRISGFDWDSFRVHGQGAAGRLFRAVHCWFYESGSVTLQVQDSDPSSSTIRLQL